MGIHGIIVIIVILVDIGSLWHIVTLAAPSMLEVMRKLEVIHKEVGGCLISYNLRLASVRKLEVILPDLHALPRRSL